MFWFLKRRKLVKLMGSLKSIIMKERFITSLEKIQFQKSKAFLLFKLQKILSKQEASDFETEIKNLSQIAGFKESDVAVAISSPPLQKHNDLAKDLTRIKNIICVASCKGGVGKSTIAINLALDYAEKGYKVGILDADVYGPSIPIMLDILDQKPEVAEGKILPIKKEEIEIASMGFLIKPEDALMWRGTMATKTIKNLFEGVQWGELDLLVVDLPPGTGDIYLSLLSTYKVTGALIVSSPHLVSTIEFQKTINVFNKFGIKIVGVVENMIENNESTMESDFKVEREPFKKDGFFRMNLDFPSKIKLS